MSFLLDGNHLLADAWPNRMGRNMTDFRSIDELDDRMVVPASPEDLAHWGELALIRRALRGNKDFIFVHIPPAAVPDAVTARIMFRVQGFVHAVELRPYGNWKGDNKHVHKAMQYLELHGSTSSEVITKQRVALAAVTECICQLFNADVREDNRDPAILRLARRAFTETVPGSQLQPVNVSVAQDPRVVDAVKLDQRWIVAHHVQAKVQTSTGGTTVVPAHAIRRNDFVEATCYPVITHDAKRNRVYVSWGLKEVLRLRTASENAMFPQHSRVDDSLQPAMQFVDAVDEYNNPASTLAAEPSEQGEMPVSRTKAKKYSAKASQHRLYKKGGPRKSTRIRINRTYDTVAPKDLSPFLSDSAGLDQDDLMRDDTVDTHTFPDDGLIDYDDDSETMQFMNELPHM